MKKEIKGELDLSELKRNGKRTLWGKSINSNIYYQMDDKIYLFKIIDYNKDRQLVKILYNDKKYNIHTSNILECCFGNIIGTCVKDFRYKIGETIQTSKKKCKILNNFRDYSGQKAYECKCLDCGNIKTTLEDYLVNKGFVCNVCSDKISYPERLMGSILNQLGVKYEYQKMFDWSKMIKFECDDKQVNKIYDFYIPSLNMIIEVNGELHYKESRWSKSRPLDYVKENDQEKRILAINNNIKKYIVINCFKSELEYIKNSIEKSEMSNIFDLSLIDWDKCSGLASTSLMKICSDLWNQGVRPTQEIANKLGISKQTVITYLKKFAEIGLNDYNPREEIRTRVGIPPTNAKGIIVIKDDNLCGIFNSATELARKSLEIYGVNFIQTEVSKIARGERYLYKGYHFKYIENLTEEEKIKYKIETN